MCVELDTITDSAAILACEKGGQWEEALGLLSEMASKGVECDTVTYSAAISACEKGCQWEEELGLLREMTSEGVKQDTITYSVAISACEEAGAFCQSDALCAKAYADGLLDHQLDSFPTDMDLHCLCASVARSAVRFVLTDLRRTASSSLPMWDLNVVTGFSFLLTQQPSSLYEMSPPHRVVL